MISPSDREALSLLIAEAEKEAHRMRKAIAEIARIVGVCPKCWEVRPCKCGALL